MQINSLADNSGHQIALVPVIERCKRVLFRQSNCHVCVDICPVDAISLPFGPEVNESCISCGLCQTACPTETFKGMFNADRQFEDCIQSQMDTIKTNGTLYVHCSQAEPDNSDSLVLNCLGNLTENAFLAATALNVKQLLVTTGQCKACRLYRGKLMFNQAVNTYSLLVTPVAYSKIKIKIREKPLTLKKKPTTNRREFFRSITHTVTKQAANAIVKKEQQIAGLLQTDIDTCDQPKKASVRREMLRGILDGLWGNSSDATLATTTAKFPWKKMLVDVVHCVGCGICVNVCPTGALRKEINSTELTRYVNHALCTNCGVCAEACPQDVIRFDQAFELSDIIEDNWEVVAKVVLNACAICGETIPVSEGEICTTCQRRQITPLFL